MMTILVKCFFDFAMFWEMLPGKSLNWAEFPVAIGWAEVLIIAEAALAIGIGLTISVIKKLRKYKPVLTFVERV